MSLIIYIDCMFKYLVYCITRNIREIKLTCFVLWKAAGRKPQSPPGSHFVWLAWHLGMSGTSRYSNDGWPWLFPLCFSFSKFVKCSNAKADSGSWPCTLCWPSDQTVRGIRFWSSESSPIQHLPRADTFGYLVLYQRLKWVSHYGRCGTLILLPGDLY